VLGLIVHVYERSCNTRQCFELVLQSLADVVRLPQRGLGVHDNIDFNEVMRSALHRECIVSYSFQASVVAYVIRASGIEFLDFWRKGGGLVDNKLKKFVRGGFTRQEAELLVTRSGPCSNDGDRNLDSRVKATRHKRPR
jgi:hypothetical protein